MKEGRVLVVDDEPTVRSWLAALLADEGYVVEEASDGAMALSVLQTFRPDVILLDLIMPGMNGREFLLELREDSALARIPVVVCTAVRGVHINLTSLGATEVLEKPPDPDQLLRTIALAMYRSEQLPTPTQPPTSAAPERTPRPRAEVVVVLDAVRSRWPRRVTELEAAGYQALARLEPMPRALRLAKAVEAMAVLVEESALAAEPSLAELVSAETGSMLVHKFDATEPEIDDELRRLLSAHAAARRSARAP